MKLRPLNDKVVVKPLIDSTTSVSGLIMPDTLDKESPEKGEVIAVGPGKLLESGQRHAMTVQVGDFVLFKRFSPDRFAIKDSEYMILSEEDILATL